MCRPFKFLLFILATQRFRCVFCYAPGSLIWSRNLQKFIPIANVSTFGAYEQEILAKSREKERHNFAGEIVKLGSAQVSNIKIDEISFFGAGYFKNSLKDAQSADIESYFQDYNMVNFIDYETKITGVCGEVWNTLAEYSNFTLVTIKVDEFAKMKGRWHLTALGMIMRNEIQIVPRMAFTSTFSHLMDFTTPIWETRYRIYVKPEWKSDTNWMFNIFEKKVWFAILLCFLLLSVFGYLMENISIKVSGDKRQRHNLHDHLFYTFGTLCSQGFIPDTIDRRSKIFGVSKKIFAWLLLIVLSSHVISHMTNVKWQPPFEDMESLLKKTNYNIAMYDSSPAVLEYLMLANNLSINMDIGELMGRRMWLFNAQEPLYNAACKKEKRAVFELEDTNQALGSRFCEMVAVGKSYFPTWITFGISKRFDYKRTFDIGIIKMKEFGLIERLKNRWLKTSTRSANSDNLARAPFTPVSLDQMLMLLVILGIGVVASAIIFVLEVIVFIYKSNQRQPVRGKGLIGGKAGLNAHRLHTDNYKKNRIERMPMVSKRALSAY